MSTDRPKRDSMSLEKADVSNMWEIAALVELLEQKRLMQVKPGLRGQGMYGLFPVSTLPLTSLATGIMVIVDALLGVLKKVPYAVSFAAGVVHGILSSLWDTVSGIAKMIYDVIESIVTPELRSDIEKLIDGLKAVTREKLKEMLGDWAAEWDEKLNSSSPFIAGHAHGYLTGYVMAEVAMLLFSGGATAGLKAAFWTTRIGKIIKASEAFATATKVAEKAIAAGGKVSEVVDKVRQSRIGSVVKAADAVVTIAGWTLEKVGKVLSLPGDIATYIVEKAFRNAEKLGPFFERIGKLAERAKRWLFGCFSPCDWEADVAQKILKQLTDEQIKIASEAANAADLKKWLGKPVKNGGELPNGYHWKKGDTVRSPGYREANFALLDIDKKTGNLTVGLSGERISNPSVMNRNYKAALKEELREANKGLSEAKLDAMVEKVAGGNAVHHLIPDNIVQDHPLGVSARKAGYDLDRGSNLKGLKKTEDLTDLDAGDIGHWSSHPNYDKLVREELTTVQKALEAEFGSLDNMLKNDKLKKRLRDEMKKVEDEFRMRIEQGKVPIDPDTGRLTEVVRANTEEFYG